jgi:hypothetical protein
MSYRDWKVGDKVVCIKRDGWCDAVFGSMLDGLPHPRYGEVCTIAMISTSPIDDDLYISVEEYPGRRCYHASRFRPVQPRKTSIEVFHRIRLNPSIRIREDA